MARLPRPSRPKGTSSKKPSAKLAKSSSSSSKLSSSSLDEELERAMQDMEHIQAYYENDDSGPPPSSTSSSLASQKAPGASATATAEPAGVDKLAVAEAVIRKLFKRNVELEKECTAARNGSGEQEAWAAVRDRDAQLASARQALERLNVACVDKDHAMRGAQARLGRAEEELETARAEQTRELAARRDEKRRAREQELAAALAKLALCEAQMEMMRKAQSQRLNPNSKRDRHVLTANLSRQLETECERQALEREAFNEKLGRLERENRNLFVEKKKRSTRC